jgi:hypothetical protein
VITAGGLQFCYVLVLLVSICKQQSRLGLSANHFQVLLMFAFKHPPHLHAKLLWMPEDGGPPSSLQSGTEMIHSKHEWSRTTSLM